MKNKDTQKRVNYPLTQERARELKRHTLDIEDKLDKKVDRQSVLDALVFLLGDKTVYSKVVKVLKK